METSAPRPALFLAALVLLGVVSASPAASRKLGKGLLQADGGTLTDGELELLATISGAVDKTFGVGSFRQNVTSGYMVTEKEGDDEVTLSGNFLRNSMLRRKNEGGDLDSFSTLSEAFNTTSPQLFKMEVLVLGDDGYVRLLEGSFPDQGNLTDVFTNELSPRSMEIVSRETDGANGTIAFLALLSENLDSIKLIRGRDGEQCMRLSPTESFFTFQLEGFGLVRGESSEIDTVETYLDLCYSLDAGYLTTMGSALESDDLTLNSTMTSGLSLQFWSQVDFFDYGTSDALPTP